MDDLYQKRKQFTMDDFGDASSKEFQTNLNFSTKFFPLTMTQWKTVKTLRAGLDEIYWKPVVGIMEDLATCGSVSRSKLHESAVNVITTVLGSEYVNQVLQQFHSETIKAEMILIESLIFSFVLELKEQCGDLFTENEKKNGKTKKDSFSGTEIKTESSYMKATESFKKKQTKWSHGSSQIYKRPQRRVKVDDKVGKQIASLEKITNKKSKFTIKPVGKSNQPMFDKTINNWDMIETVTDISNSYNKEMKVSKDKTHEKSPVKNTEVIKCDTLLLKMGCNVKEQPEKDVSKKVNESNDSMTSTSTMNVDFVSNEEYCRIEKINPNQRERELRDKMTSTDFHEPEDSLNTLDIVKNITTGGRYELNTDPENLVAFRVTEELADIIKIFLQNPHNFIPLDNCYTRSETYIPTYREFESIRSESRKIMNKLNNITILSSALLAFSVLTTGIYFFPLSSQTTSMVINFFSRTVCEWCQ